MYVDNIFISVFENIEDYAPGFLESIIGVDILTPPDLEREFSLTGGVCIFIIITQNIL